VAGARIRSRASGRIAVAALGAGAAAGAAGYILDSGGLVQAGAALLVGGAAALTWHGLRVQRDAVGWSSEHDWHRLASWSFVAAPAWVLVAALVVAIRVVGAGAGGEGWRLTDVAGPLIAGFAIQVLLGAMTNLMPAVGATGHAERAIARRELGRLGTARVVAWNAGTAALTLGLLGDVPTIALIGLATLGLAAAAAAGAVGSAILRR
jgi:nitrite reductase (NO-forming)